MDFERLRYLAALGRSGSVRGAAAALHVTPGAVSKAISRLEEEVGSPLVAASGRGVMLTPDGAWLARRAEHLVGEHAALRDDLESRQSRDTGICIASYDTFVEGFPAIVARQFLPGVPLSVRERYPGEIETAVAERVSDMGITWAPVATEGIAHVVAARTKLGVYTARGAFADVATLDLPFAVPMHPVKGVNSQYGPLDGWPVDAPARNVRFLTSALEARLALARQGQAAIVIPDFVARQHDALVLAARRLEARPVPRGLGTMSRTVSLVTAHQPTELIRTRAASVLAAVRAVCAAP